MLSLALQMPTEHLISSPVPGVGIKNRGTQQVNRTVHIHVLMEITGEKKLFGKINIQISKIPHSRNPVHQSFRLELRVTTLPLGTQCHAGRGFHPSFGHFLFSLPKPPNSSHVVSSHWPESLSKVIKSFHALQYSSQIQTPFPGPQAPA